jgi:hypothetical protein
MQRTDSPNSNHYPGPVRLTVIEYSNDLASRSRTAEAIFWGGGG